jgi:hypothetical protein
VAQFKHNTSVAAKTNNKTIEKLFWNGKVLSH